jgi:hypothetical protein
MSVTECLGYPYSIQLAVGYPYMITTNVDVEGGIVHDAIGTLIYFEKLHEDGVAEEMIRLEHGYVINSASTKMTRLWFKFPNEHVGRRLRIRAKPHVLCELSVLKLDWTPI